MAVIQTAQDTFKHRFKGFINRLFEQRWVNVGLRTKMSILVEVGLIGLIAIFLFLGISTARQTMMRIMSERAMLAKLSASTLDTNLRQIRSVLEIVAGSNLIWGDEASDENRRAVLEAAYKKIEWTTQGIYLLDQNGAQISSISAHGALRLNWAELLGKSAPFNDFEVREISTDHTLAVIMVPVFDDQGQFCGCLAAVLDFTRGDLSPFHGAIDLGETGAIDLVNSAGRVLVSSNPNRPTAIASLSSLSRLILAGEPVVETCLGCTGEESSGLGDEVIAFAPLTDAPWGVIVRQSAAELMAPVNRLLIQTLVLGLATIIGALGLVWVTTNSVIKPVQSLKEAAVRITMGDLNTPMEIFDPGWFSFRRRRLDEIGSLAESFETMRRQLKRSMDEINELNRELDRRVQERTQEALNAQLQAQSARDDLRAIIDALDDELIVVGVDDYHIKLANKAAHEHHGQNGAFVEQLCYQTCASGRLKQNDMSGCPVAVVQRTGETARVTQELPGPDGMIYYREVTASPMRDASGRVTRVVELSRDVTEEKMIKASLLRRNQQLSIINAVATTVNQSLKLEDILDRSLDAVLRLTEVDMGAVFLYEEFQGTLRLMAYRGISEEAAQVAASMGLLDGSCGGVVEHGQVVIVPDLSRYKGRRARSLQHEGLNTLVHVPLTIKGNTLGSMCVGTHQGREFSTEDQELLKAIGSQIAVAIENARLYAEVQAKERMRGELFKKAINAQEDERKRIARELHDETSQSLTALLYAAEEALEMKTFAAARKKIEGMRDLAQHTLDGVHKLIFDLRPSMLDHLGLAPAIRWLAKSRLEARGLRVVIQEKGEIGRLPAEIETALFRVVQEAITNIAKHSAARNVVIQYEQRGEKVYVRVEDDGVGFNIANIEIAPDTPRGLGLIGMQERLELLGGEMYVHSTPGSGTVVEIVVPSGNGRAEHA
jgi:signal transduction histidine kinase/HAMP domain-containing protein